MNMQDEKPLLAAVKGVRQQRPPIWIMRQAGRYLPEYRAVRAKADGFLDLCFRPELATEVTLQPLKRFPLDGAILFSDILVIPHALGQSVRFEVGEGPILDPVESATIGALAVGDVVKRLASVLETVANVRAALDRKVALIGFCGSPWTVATYMIGGRGSSDQAKAREFALNEPEAFRALIDILVEASVDYLVAQFEAGADVVQLFESWAMNLDDSQFRRYVIEPNARIVAGVRNKVPGAPIIGFPRGAAGMVGEYIEKTGVNMVGLDYAMPLEFVGQHIPEKFGVQGNLDPLRVVAGGAQMRDRVEEILVSFADRPHVFNLGHGIVPHTPITHVAELVAQVKGISVNALG